MDRWNPGPPVEPYTQPGPAGTVCGFGRFWSASVAVTIVDSGLGVRGEETAVGQWLVGIWGYQQKHAHSMSQQVLLVDLEC